MTPNIRYINQSAPFWDFVAGMEDGDHPFFNRFQAPEAGSSAGPSWHHGGRRGVPHRGPPPYQATAEGEAEASPSTAQNDTDMKEKDETVPDPPEETPGQPGEGHRGRRGRCGGGPCGAGRRGWGHHHRGTHGHHGPHGPPPHFARGFPFGGPRGGFGFLADMFNPNAAENNNEQGDFNPDADIFDTESAYVVHLSLPGAIKEDIGVSWDPEKSELVISGVVHRPGDEEFLKTLALDERKVGAFERKIRLGTRASPASVDVDGITAKLENGILVVDVPKLNGEFVEVRKVDIE